MSARSMKHGPPLPIVATTPVTFSVLPNPAFSYFLLVSSSMTPQSRCSMPISSRRRLM